MPGGDATADSDIDIAIFLDPPLQMAFFDIKTALYLEISRSLKMNDIDIVVLNHCKNIILLDRITRHGQVIYESNQDARLDFEQKVLHTAIDFKYQRKRVMGV
ncbi:DNA polymerase beta domain-containing protein [Desulfotignum phosphitoxidans DSM 13687]|uniref:DNA polymerase beta domain-containing protein n=2 Tax=Desulfotignum phosphitoxidans TaxID=190898 RepID=S0FWI8_9BACT|nr:DNA polymerase beta domain-containing protein [Desulfotignum phosphitoxidans DSM 13687]